jgi:Ca2+-binding RTX toxin-like protein
MAILRAFRAFDMRIIVREDGDAEGGDDGIEIADGVWRTTFTGDFQATPAGYTGTLTGFAQTHDGRRVFEATGVEAHADTALAIVEDRDNDRFLAYTLYSDDRILGSRRDDYLIGFGGDDRLRAGAGEDELFGGIGRDDIEGGAGDDFLAGGEDADRMAGGFGADTYLVADRSDRVIEAADAGRDTILSYVTTTIAQGVERLVLIGDDRIHARGSQGADEIDGNEARNRLEGGGDRDLLDGDGGSDLLDGGFGRDTLTGGRGGDLFRFLDARAADGDRIRDFGAGADRIDLSDLDGAPRRGLDWIGGDAFSGRAGEIRAADNRLSGDLDGDGLADFAIRLGDADLGRADLIL